MAPTTPPPVLAVPLPCVYEVGGPSTAVAEGPSFPQERLKKTKRSKNSQKPTRNERGKKKSEDEKPDQPIQQERKPK
ncbi:hypothetical protein Tco_0742577 [Tanacetum coccineum]